MQYDTIIVGGGPAGLTAANNTAHRGLKTLVIEAKPQCGGQPHYIFPSKPIKDHPGFPNGVSGEELSKRLMLQTKSSGAEIHTNEEVLKIKPLKKEIHVITTKGSYQTRKVIIATGLLSHPKKHPILEKNLAVNVSHSIQKIDYKTKSVAIIGGGDSAFDNAYQLSKLAKGVTVLIREQYAKAKKSTVELAIKNGVKVFYNINIVDAVFKDNKIKSIKIESGRKSAVISPDEIIVCIGYLSAKNFLLSQGLRLNKDSSVKVDRFFETNIKGVFAAGDVTGEIKLIAVACAEGISAAIHAFEEIKKPYWLH